jgi:hypothetical protein
MTRPYSSLTRRDLALDAQALTQRAADLAPMLDEVEAKSEPPSRPAITIPLCLLANGCRFVLAGQVYEALDEELEIDGVRHRLATKPGSKLADAKWLPGTTEVRPCVAGTGEVAK